MKYEPRLEGCLIEVYGRKIDRVNGERMVSVTMAQMRSGYCAKRKYYKKRIGVSEEAVKRITGLNARPRKNPSQKWEICAMSQPWSGIWHSRIEFKFIFILMAIYSTYRCNNINNSNINNNNNNLPKERIWDGGYIRFLVG